jgi:hypothetical protein
LNNQHNQQAKLRNNYKNVIYNDAIFNELF